MATGATYTVETADQLHKLSCKVTGENSSGKAEAKRENSVEVPGSGPGQRTADGGPAPGKSAANSRASRANGRGVPVDLLHSSINGWSARTDHRARKLRATRSLPKMPDVRSRARSPAKTRYGKAFEVSKPLPVEGEPPPGPSTPGTRRHSPGRPAFPRPGTRSPAWKAHGMPNRPSRATTYQWFREGTTVGVGKTKVQAAEDRGQKLHCRVTAKNHSGAPDGQQRTGSDQGPQAGSQSGRAPDICGAAVVGETLTCAPGSWEAAPKPTFSYHWLRDGVVASGQQLRDPADRQG